jgi:predicted RNA-binding protein with PUA-like domain
MNYWLVKTEPETWSWDMQVKHGRTNWDGVRNHQAANNLKAMKKGDLVLFYHSGDEKQIVGLVKVGKEHMPDPKDETGKFVMVEMVTVGPVEKKLTLKEIKADKRLQDLLLVRHSRLSVMPVDKKSWAIICEQTGLAP